MTGRSKGYGFVRFGTEEERDMALTEMNGEMCMGRALRISVATPKKPGVHGMGPRGELVELGERLREWQKWVIGTVGN